MPTRKRFVAFEVFINRKRQFLAGHANQSVLTASVTWGASDEPFLYVGGLTASRAGKESYTTWCKKGSQELYQFLRPGDEVRLRVLEVDHADAPHHRETKPAESNRQPRKRPTRSKKPRTSR